MSLPNKKIRIIINPKSGHGPKLGIAERIAAFFRDSPIDAELMFTNAPGHATELSRQAVAENYYSVVVVGGDGSVNETAAGLVNSRTALGIIPAGSGNGMALHLGISLEEHKALELILNGTARLIDTVKVNDRFCIGTIGVGFDAHVAHLFAKSPKRGYSTYVKLVLGEFYKYPCKKYDLELDGKKISMESFLLTFANSSQFGNNAVIAPFADENDGILEITSISKFPLIAAPGLIWKLMHNNLYTSRYFSGFKAANVLLHINSELTGHIDGEPVLFTKDLHIKTIPDSLLVIAPPKK